MLIRCSLYLYLCRILIAGLILDSNITIIGAGVVGLAIAGRLSLAQKSVFVIEKHKKFGQEASSRNSEVIHSGIYYPNGSLKAQLCVDGKEKLYQYCDQYSIAYRKCGKLIVGTNTSDRDQLSSILRQAKENGVFDALWVEKKQIEELEPNIHGDYGIFFPSSGIIDTHSLMKQLESESALNGVNFVYNAEVLTLRKIKGGYELDLKDADGENFSFTSEKVVNSAGLTATQLAREIGIADPDYQVFYWKGEYFSIGNGKHKLVNRLVYPVPEENSVGLGIHTTIDLDGRVKLGPNALYLENGIPEYSVDIEHATQFYESTKKFLPFLKIEDLSPDQAGVRPKLQKPGDQVRDFLIKEESERGLPGLVNLIGIESTGLTACLSIAEYVSTLINS